MNKLMGVFLLGTALSLTACGGDSDSSGSNYSGKDTTPTTPDNGQNTCDVVGNTVTGVANSDCQFTAENTDAQITCTSTALVVDGTIGGITLSNTTFISNSTNIGGYSIQCS
ncbi:hypothetical protein [uncultured Psychrobacter sp.]|uniref:hypothetical protein n=1 Tax=uncultured Psychrobacter sp. TaxID=259303 RepID=UPI00345A21A0